MSDLVAVKVPDIGDFDGVEVIEILVSPGDIINVEDSLITVESDKAAMEIPSTHAGTVKQVKLNMGDTVNEGSVVLLLEESEAVPVTTAVEKESAKAEPAKVGAEKAAPAPVSAPQTNAQRASPTANIAIDNTASKQAHASPAIRKFARELGVDLTQLSGAGRNGRILKDDVQAFVKLALSRGTATTAGGATLGVEPMPEIDFSQWGEVDTQPLSKINLLTGKFLHRNWVNIPHVTQFDEADISALEEFRKQANIDYAEKGIKVTLLSFIMKAVVAALTEYPKFNASLDVTGSKLIQKKYFHIGVAVATPGGLVVPVIRDVERKSLGDLALELTQMSIKARDKKLKPGDMQGGCFTISSLGGIGGTKFTPIVNAPEVAILGVSRAKMQPVWNGTEFKPRLMCPLALSYDHRVIDGADGAAFTTYLSKMLTDVRRLLM
jgi:pyruvate dehydrogenase E2 component (dihydrolipoamide acetyltransferase)